MKGIFWNSRGLGDLAKHKYILDVVRERQLDFVALMETGRSTCPDSLLRHLCGSLNFLWYIMPPHGRSGEIIFSVNMIVFHIRSIIEGDYYTKFLLNNKEDDFMWALYAVYGLGQDEHKAAFLTEMASM